MRRCSFPRLKSRPGSQGRCVDHRWS
jgi:hypothetical protein